MSLVKLTKTDLKTIDNQNDKMNQVDKQLVDVRKQSIFQALTTATNARVNMIQNTQRWLAAMENKIFNPAFINDLNPSKTIALFKYINNLNLKALVETDRLEIVLNNYIQSGALETSAEMNKDNVKTADIRQLKTDIMSKLSGILQSNTTDAVVIPDPIKKEEKQPQDDTEMEEKTMDDLDLQLSKIDLG